MGGVIYRSRLKYVGSSCIVLSFVHVNDNYLGTYLWSIVVGIDMYYFRR